MSAGVINLVASPGLDIVKQSSYTLSLTVTDGFLTSSVENLVVQISWVNQGPQFDTVKYVVTIPEKCNNVRIAYYCSLNQLKRVWSLGRCLLSVTSIQGRGLIRFYEI